MLQEEQKFLNKLCVRYIKEHKSKLELDENDPEFQDLIEKYEQGILSADIYAVIDQAYISSRAAHFPHKHVRGFEYVVSEASKHVETVYDSGTYYRVPKNRGRMKWDRNDKTEDILSLNVVQDKKLIKKLDEFTTKHKCFYTTVEPENWNKTVAPIHIYFKEPLDEKTYRTVNEELTKIVTPYARIQDAEKAKIAYADDFSAGVYREKTIQTKDLDENMDSLKKELPLHIYHDIERFVAKRGTNLNLVEIKAIDNVARTYVRQYLGNIQLNIRNEELKENKLIKTGQEDKATEPEKKVYRTIYKEVAKRDKAQYKEDATAKIFKTQIIKSNGETLTVEANKNNMALIAKDKTGKVVVPDYKYFEDAAAAAAKAGKGINLATLKRPESKARALLACLTRKPPVKTIKAPVLDREFLNSLHPQTRVKLQPFVPARAKEPDLKTIVFGKNFEKVKDNTAKPQKRTDVKFLNIKPTVVNHPKPVETTKPNGNYVYAKDAKMPSSWELTFRLQPKADSKPVSRFLKILQVNHTVVKDAQSNGKAITAYTSSNKDNEKLGAEIQKTFPKQVEQKSLQESFIPKAWSEKAQDLKAIFTSQKTIASDIIVPIRVSSAKTEEFLVDAAIRRGVLNEKTIAPIAENKDPKLKNKALLLESYVSHQIYAKHGKENYYGKDKLGFEKEVFGKNLLPKIGSKERQEWDLIAGQYETFLLKNTPERLKLMERVISHENPIDFQKAELFMPEQGFSKTGIKLMGKELD